MVRFSMRLIAGASALVAFTPTPYRPLLILAAIVLGVISLIPSGRAGAKVCFVISALCFFFGVIIPFAFVFLWPIGMAFAIRVAYYFLFTRREEAAAGAPLTTP